MHQGIQLQTKAGKARECVSARVHLAILQQHCYTTTPKLVPYACSNALLVYGDWLPSVADPSGLTKASSSYRCRHKQLVCLATDDTPASREHCGAFRARAPREAAGCAWREGPAVRVVARRGRALFLRSIGGTSHSKAQPPKPNTGQHSRYGRRN